MAKFGQDWRTWNVHALGRHLAINIWRICRKLSTTKRGSMTWTWPTKKESRRGTSCTTWKKSTSWRTYPRLPSPTWPRIWRSRTRSLKNTSGIVNTYVFKQNNIRGVYEGTLTVWIKLTSILVLIFLTQIRAQGLNNFHNRTELSLEKSEVY